MRESGYDLEPVFESPFVHIDFHTAVIGKDVKYLCEGCFNGCKNLRKIILSDSVDAIEWPIAKDAGLEYFEEDGLLFLGSENNLRLALVGCVDDYGADEVVIPAATKVIAANVDWPIYVKTLIHPDGTTVSVNENVTEATGDDALPF